MNDEIVDLWLHGALADEVHRIAETDGRCIGDVLKRLIQTGIRHDCIVRRRVREMISDAGGSPRG